MNPNQDTKYICTTCGLDTNKLPKGSIVLHYYEPLKLSQRRALKFKRLFGSTSCLTN